MAQRRTDLIRPRVPGLTAKLAGPLIAYSQMAVAAGEDIVGTLSRRSEAADPFAMRDPEYIQRTLPALRLSSELYFRADVRGLDKIPAEGPVLLVGNHSGGTMIADTFVFTQAFYDHFGPGRPFFQLAHDLVFRFPGLRALVQRYGTVPASPANMTSALERGAALLVYPGGDQETFRPTWESDRIAFAQRMGFVRLALEHDVPVIPIVAIGGQETGLFLGRGRRLAGALGLKRLMRLSVLPPVVGPPLGMTILDLPLRIPIPAKIAIRVLEPIDLRKRLGRSPDLEQGYRLVTSTMQRTLTTLSHQRSVPVVG